MNKKIFIFFLALVASVGTIIAESGTCGENLKWELNTETGMLTISGTGEMANYEDCFNQPWYETGEDIKSVIIEDGVTSIGNHAFDRCSSLTAVTIPNSITSIGIYAFLDCNKMTSMTIPNSVTSIGMGAFKGCEGLTSVTIPNSVTSIEWGVFNSCSRLISVEIPNSVTSIESQAFNACTGLISVEIPNSVTNIESYAFGNVPNIVYSGTAAGSPWGAKSINGYVDGYLVYSDDTKTNLLACSTAATGEIVIPNSVTSIGDNAFYDCRALISVTIPNSVTNIGDAAFNYVPNIMYSGTATGLPWGARSVNGYVDGYLVYSDDTKTNLLACSTAANGDIIIPNSVTNIGDEAFLYCTGLTSVFIPNSVTSIGGQAFGVCEKLSNINIPNSVTYIGSHAFIRCYSLTSIEIPEGVEVIRPYTFNSCNSLASVIIPNSVTRISTSSFTGCSSLTSIDIPNSVTMIDHYSFANCTGLTSISIPNSVTSIGSQAFLKCNGLNSISVEAGNTVYDSREDCNAIIETASNTLITGCKNTIIPNSVTSIENWAFQFCEGLASVEIPNSVTSIGIRAFDLCTGLTSITCEAVNPPTLGQEVFYEIDKSIPLYVPAESVDDYKAADQWKDFNVQAIKDCTIETTDGITVWEDDLPYIWEDKIFTEAGTQTTTLKSVDGCDSIVTFTLRVRYNNIVLQENESSEYYDLFAEDYNGYTVNTATLNRQFTQGRWATLCLPFNVNKAMMMSLGLYNRVFAFRYAQQLDDETIQVFFVPAQSIEAGKGYIVNPNAKLAAKTSFVFPNVTINTDSDNGDITALTGYNDGTNRGNLYLVGTLRTGILQGTTAGNTYLGLKDNQLYYPNTTTGTSIRAYRGFFRSDIPVNASRVRIIAEGESVTELEVTVDEQGRMDNVHLQETPPARKYLRNGLLFIERNGVTYTAQGQRID